MELELDTEELLIRNEAEENYIAAIKKIVGGDAEVKMVNAEGFYYNNLGHTRFLYGFVISDGEPAKFVKMASINSINENQKQLEKECKATQLAEQLGAKTLKVVHEYAETPHGFAGICLESLSSKEGETLTTPELIITADDRYGIWAAETIYLISGKIVPADADISILNNNDVRNRSAKSFWQIWNMAMVAVLDLPREEQLILSVEQTTEYKKIFKSISEDIFDDIDMSFDKETLYFVHNDTSPNNTFFDTKQEQALLLDWEHAGTTHSSLLARYTDLGNFYARCWPNQEMQKIFLKNIFDLSGTENAEFIYRHLRGVIAFATLNLSMHVMNPEHHNHNMAKALLKEFPENLAYIDSLFELKKSE